MNQPPFIMRQPCKQCGCMNGTLTEVPPHIRVNCYQCGAYCYFASKIETGQRPRTIRTTHESISPSQRYRILERATGHCEICGSNNKQLHVAHILSVEDGHSLQLPDAVINDDENLAAFCDECNLGMGKYSIPPRLYVALLRRRYDRGHQC